MIIAIPIHEDRVMPRFGCARDVMIITVEAGAVRTTKRLTSAASGLQPLLTDEHVTILICGGIHPRFQQRLQQQNIEIVWGVVGHWRDVVQAYLDGTLQHNRNLCVPHRHAEECRLRHRHQGRG